MKFRGFNFTNYRIRNINFYSYDEVIKKNLKMGKNINNYKIIYKLIYTWDERKYHRFVVDLLPSVDFILFKPLNKSLKKKNNLKNYIKIKWFFFYIENIYEVILNLNYIKPKSGVKKKYNYRYGKYLNNIDYFFILNQKNNFYNENSYSFNKLNIFNNLNTLNTSINNSIILEKFIYNNFFFKKFNNIKNIQDFHFYKNTYKYSTTYSKHLMYLYEFFFSIKLKINECFSNIFINLKKKKIIQNKIKFKLNHLKIFYKKQIFLKKYFVKSKIILIGYAYKPLQYFLLKNKNTMCLIRKQRFFSKNKYPRTRQYCKNIVFIGLLINIFFMFILNSTFYNININLNYIPYIYYIIILYITLYYNIKYFFIKNIYEFFINYFLKNFINYCKKYFKKISKSLPIYKISIFIIFLFTFYKIFFLIIAISHCKWIYFSTVFY